MDITREHTSTLVASLLCTTDELTPTIDTTRREISIENDDLDGPSNGVVRELSDRPDQVDSGPADLAQIQEAGGGGGGVEAGGRHSGRGPELHRHRVRDDEIFHGGRRRRRRRQARQQRGVEDVGEPGPCRGARDRGLAPGVRAPCGDSLALPVQRSASPGDRPTHQEAQEQGSRSEPSQGPLLPRHEGYCW